MNLIILSERDGIGGNSYRLNDHRARHIIDILRAKTGEQVAVGLINGPVGMAQIETIENGVVTLCCLSMNDPKPPEIETDIICAIPRPKTLKKILQLSATMGVRRLHLVRACRIEKSYFQTPLLQQEHYMPYLIEGLAQGKQTRLPDIIVHELFRPFIEDTLPELVREYHIPPLKLYAHPKALGKLDKVYDKSAHNIMIAVGPEAGWVPFECDLLEKAGFMPFSLGPWVLRVESAFTAVMAQLELLRKSL